MVFAIYLVIVTVFIVVFYEHRSVCRSGLSSGARFEITFVCNAEIFGGWERIDEPIFLFLYFRR